MWADGYRWTRTPVELPGPQPRSKMRAGGDDASGGIWDSRSVAGRVLSRSNFRYCAAFQSLVAIAVGDEWWKCFRRICMTPRLDCWWIIKYLATVVLAVVDLSMVFLVIHAPTRAHRRVYGLERVSILVLVNTHDLQCCRRRRSHCFARFTRCNPDIGNWCFRRIMIRG